MKNDPQKHQCKDGEGILYYSRLELGKHGISKDAFRIIERLMIEEYERGLYDGANHVIDEINKSKYSLHKLIKENYKNHNK